MDKTQLKIRLLPVVTNLHWERLEDYLDFIRKEQLESLARCSDIRQINKLQGKIEMLDYILGLPEMAKKAATSR